MGDTTVITGGHALPLSGADPRELDGYRVLARLGAGGMGVVYLAQRGDGPRVALKVMRSEFVEQREFRSRFVREVEAAQSVRSDHVARVLDADVSGASPWVATEYVTGPTLATQIEHGGPMALDEVGLLADGLTDALAAIHASGLVHRDLKPANVLIAAHGPMVIDFGIAHVIDATSLTGVGSSLGSLAWMSPEQINGARVAPASDMFALGLVLAYASSGRHPFGEGRSEAVAFRITSRDPDLTHVPQSLRSIIAALLAKAPEDRPTTGGFHRELASTTRRDATRVLHTSPDQTRILAPTRAAGPDSPSGSDPTTQLSTTAPAGSKRHAPLIAAILALVVIAVGGAGAALGAMTAGDLGLAASPSAQPEQGPADGAAMDISQVVWTGTMNNGDYIFELRMSESSGDITGTIYQESTSSGSSGTQYLVGTRDGDQFSVYGTGWSPDTPSGWSTDILEFRIAEAGTLTGRYTCGTCGGTWYPIAGSAVGLAGPAAPAVAPSGAFSSTCTWQHRDWDTVFSGDQDTFEANCGSLGNIKLTHQGSQGSEEYRIRGQIGARPLEMASVMTSPDTWSGTLDGIPVSISYSYANGAFVVGEGSYIGDGSLQCVGPEPIGWRNGQPQWSETATVSGTFGGSAGVTLEEASVLCNLAAAEFPARGITTYTF